MYMDKNWTHAKYLLMGADVKEVKADQFLEVAVRHGLNPVSFAIGFVNLIGKDVNFATVETLLETAGSRMSAHAALALYYDKEHPSR